MPNKLLTYTVHIVLVNTYYEMLFELNGTQASYKTAYCPIDTKVNVTHRISLRLLWCDVLIFKIAVINK